MAFKLKVILDSAAFEENRAAEVSRILRDVARRVEEKFGAGNIRDSDGNPIGNWEFEVGIEICPECGAEKS